MKKHVRKALSLALLGALCAGLCAGCAQKPAREEHEPLTILTGGINYGQFQTLLAETYPEVKLELIGYSGANGSGYAQYLLKNGAVPDIYGQSVFGLQDKQQEYLLDLSGYEFVNSYKTADLKQVTLNGGVYMLPTCQNIIGLYYNKTLFAERGWTVPRSLDELKTLAADITAAGFKPLSAQFALSGNGFFDLFTMAKTDFLSTQAGLEWERDFQAGTATAEEGLSGAVDCIQALLDSGILDPADANGTQEEALNAFFDRSAALYLNAGTLPRFTQNEDGTGDEYGIMPFLGTGPDSTVLITLPIRYYGLSRTLGEPGREEKLADALKVMALLATEEGQEALMTTRVNYMPPLKNSTIPDDSPFREVADVIQSGHTSNLAYAGYEPIIIPVGDKVRDWVAGRCTGADVLALMDELQSAYLNEGLEPVAVAGEDLSQEQVAQLEADALRQAAGAEIGLVSLGEYHAGGSESMTGVCGELFQGDLSQDIVNAVLPGSFQKPISVLTLTGTELRGLMETGLVKEAGEEGFPYVPAGIVVTRNADGTVRDISLEKGGPMDGAGVYTVAVNSADFSGETGRKGDPRETELIMQDVVSAYFAAHSPLSALEPSLK